MSASIVDSIKQILDRNTFPTELEIFPEQLVSKTLVIYGAGNGLESFYMFVLNKLNIKPFAILDNKFSNENKTNGVLYSCLKIFIRTANFLKIR